MLDFTVFFASKIYPLKESSVSGGGIEEKGAGKGISFPLLIVPLSLLNLTLKLPSVINMQHVQIIQPTCNENTETYQVEVSSFDLTPNSYDLFTRKYAASKGEN